MTKGYLKKSGVDVRTKVDLDVYYPSKGADGKSVSGTAVLLHDHLWLVLR